MRFLSFIFFLFLHFIAFSQEINCSVLVNDEIAAQKDTRIDKEIIANLRTGVSDFMNTRRWTEDDFETNEKITCNLVVSITRMPQLGRFEANFQFQSSRTIYGTNYESAIFSFINTEIPFEYNSGQNIDFNENAYISNLSSLLAFYIYMTLAIDYDSFSELGGTAFYTKALNIANAAQSSNLAVWSSSTSGKNINNAYWLINNATNPQFENFRKGYYKYHRLAMDQLNKKPAEGQDLIIKVLEDIAAIKKIVPMSILIETFLSAKTTEIINIFKPAPIEKKQKVLAVLQQIDATNSQKFQQIMRP